MLTISRAVCLAANSAIPKETSETSDRMLARTVAGQAAKVNARCHAAMHALVRINGISRCLTVQIAQQAHGRHRDVRQLLDCLPLQLGVQQLPRQLQPATVVGWP